ncbi:unnamed protein product [Rotaria sp. Silwood1]|nr:unnamed protein product [Rotaria sp. Silwood1]CAF0961453.1 unnamed protein product [Rotaria sp. Silwood1]CAF3347678.1 unnamed protein product [Rotaria sp. Silwood1]CAF3375563.1 unnamed protein product [Rotaria sp. Silwood1]CAF4600836.1 unnamed protein product [Rotaria sp. Silwood1]
MALYYDEILAGNCFGQINVAPPPPKFNRTNEIDKKQLLSLSNQFESTIEELFYLARKFLKENKEIQLKYNDNIRLITLSKQAKFGKWNASYTQDVGFLDVVGNDRKQAWIALGDMSKEQAMEEYVKLLLDRCPIFRTYLETQHVHNEDKDQLRNDYETYRRLEQEAERARKYELEQVLRLEKQKKKREVLQRKQIQEALNQQTYSQFKAYAEQQYRDNRSAQEELIRQLQEQHFQKYMQQVYQQQLLDQQLRTKANMEQQSENVITSSVPTDILLSPSIPANSVVSPNNIVTTLSPTTEIPPSVPTNVDHSPITFNPNMNLQSISQIPPLGPAPTQLPPLVHPPPQPVINTNITAQDIKSESVIPIQTQFETLNLDIPLESIPSVIPQPSFNSDLAQQSLSSVEISNELNNSQELMNEHVITSSSIDSNATVNSNNESSLVSEQDKPELPNIAPANMWTRKDIKEFKDQIRKEKDAVIKIGSGETVTVRVPTHEDGQCIFWEFATDYYDLGFGVYFEWTKAESNTVTVHVSDSSDEEEENEDAEKKDIEKGSGSTNKPPKPRQNEIVPIYRRDCHEEVYAGSHPYPGHGVYLLKFDNSYSLWRSKTLYYRVYYSK